MDFDMAPFAVQFYLEMKIDRQQRRVVITTIPTPFLIILVIFLGCQSGVKYPATGPHELMWLDLIMATLVTVTCWKRIILTNCWRMVFYVAVRILLFYLVGSGVFTVPPEYHKPTLVPSIPFQCRVVVWAYLMCVAASIISCICLISNMEVRDRLTWENLKLCYCKDDTVEEYEGGLPEYHEIMSPSSLPPSYQQAIASSQTGHTPTNTTPVTTPTAITMSHGCILFDRYQAELEEETMF